MSRLAGDEVSDVSEWGFLVSDCLALKSLFHSVKFVHVKKEANCVAHVLAHHAIEVDGEVVWLEEVAEVVHGITMEEAALLFSAFLT